MSISDFNVKEQWTGDGTLKDYTFDFTIQDLEHLLIIVQDAGGAQQQKLRGSDTSFLSGVVFDAVNGGGTVSLLDYLSTDWTITLLLANDLPTQPSEFRNKSNFTLKLFELALDFVTTALQRTTYLAQRSFKLNDLDDIDNFDMTLPLGIANNPGATLAVNTDGDGFAYGATLGDIANAQSAATAAIASAATATTKAAAAATSAVAAAASAAGAAGGFTPSNTRGAPALITAAGGITKSSAQRELQFIQGSPGAVIITANPQISNGIILSQELLLVCVTDDDSKPVTLSNGNGLRLSGDCKLYGGDTILLFWDGVNWNDFGRR